MREYPGSVPENDMQLLLTTHKGIRQELQLYSGRQQVCGEAGIKTRQYPERFPEELHVIRFSMYSGNMQEPQFCPDDSMSAGKRV